MSTQSIPQNPPTKHNNNEAQRLLAEFDKLPDNLKQIYLPVKEAIFGKKQVNHDR